MEIYHEEEIQGKAYDNKLMKRLLQYLRPYLGWVITGVVLLLVLALLQLALPRLTQIAIDQHIANGNIPGLVKITILFLVVTVLTFVGKYIQQYLVEWLGQQVMYDMRMHIFRHLQKLSLRYFDKNPVGRLVTRVTNDVEAINELLSAGVVSIFGDIFLLIGIIVAMLWYDWKMALVTFSILPLLFYATFLFRAKVRTAYRDIRIRLARINSFLQENITGMSIIQIFNRQERNRNRFDRLNYDHLEAYLRTIKYYAIFYPTVDFLSSLAVALILWYGGFQILKNEGLTIGILVAFIQYVERFFRPISDLSEKYNLMQAAMASSERIFKLLDEKPQHDPVSIGTDNRPVHGELELKNVWFAYEGEKWVLEDISFHIKPGEKVALVGATGAGKTSIVNLFTRMYEYQKGQVLLDGIDTRTLSLPDLRKRFAVVLQDVVIFAGTVNENIRLGNQQISDEMIRQVAKDVNAHRFIKKLKNQYNEELSERGSTLSVGQRQLLAFARALAFNPEILILDEATSSVDTETELLIRDALEKLMRNRTSIIIAHRLSTIQNVDRIIVMHKGRIREIGSHQELLAQKGIYYRLYQLQYASHEGAIKETAA